MIVWQQHEILKPPSDDEMAVMDAQDLVELHALYHEAIANSVNDPYRYGFQLENWKKMDEEFAEVTEALALGGNRSGKTRYGARSVVKAAVENPNSEIFCFAQTSISNPGAGMQMKS